MRTSGSHATLPGPLLAPLVRRFMAGPPSGLEGLFLFLLRRAVAACRTLIPYRAGRLAWLEFDNQIALFHSFRKAAVLLAPRMTSPALLSERIHSTQTLGPYLSLWTIEGLGYYYAEIAQESDPSPQNLLADDVTRTLPAGCMVPLHAGMGTSFGMRLLRTLSRSDGETQIREMIHRFLNLCEGNSTTGCVGGAIETLGLVIRTLHPQRLRAFERALLKVDPEQYGYFWHGVGRGLYLAFPRALHSPRSRWSALAMAQQEPRSAAALRNAVSGFAWPLLMVNIRHPDILEHFIWQHRRDLASDTALTDGFRSVSLIWHAWAGHDAYSTRFFNHLPLKSETEATDLWKHYLVEPCMESMASCSADLQESRRFGELYRFREAVTGHRPRT